MDSILFDEVKFVEYAEAKQKMIFDISNDSTSRHYRIESNEDLQCRICNGPARGYHFNQICCQPCKSFFRRNARHDQSKLICRYSNQCRITVETRHHCPACRLKKCFDNQMRKERIRSDEECFLKRIQRQQKSSLSSRLDRSHSKKMNSSNLTIDDWSLINSISQTYETRAFVNQRNSLENYSLENSTLIDFFNDEQIIYRNLIEFYKRIPLFQQLHLDDQMLLIKSNLTHLVHLHHILKDRFQENPRIGSLMSKWISPDFHQHMSENRHRLDHFVEHPMILKISLLVFIFLTNFSRISSDNFSFQIHDHSTIMNNQNLLITLLWKYLHMIYDEITARKSFQTILFQYLRYQSLISEMEMIISKKFHSNEFHPLIKSLLHFN